jgi:3D-(3,5/4)-trihydroxycyclohexane-1,2-dione acylhydrolase (decyclizing)
MAAFATALGIPVVETVAGKSALLPNHPLYAGPVGVAGAEATNALVKDADLIIAVGTRLEDFTTGSWTAFASDAQFVALNAARFDALKHRALPVIGDAQESLLSLQETLSGWRANPEWTARATLARAGLEAFVAARTAPDGVWPPSYAQLISEVHASATAEDYVLTAAGGLPGEVNVNWSSKGIASVDTEYGFSCMGYEIAGAWGAAFARTSGQVYTLVGDGSFLMLNSDIYSSVLSGKKFILLVCDNEGYAVIERLQVGQGGASYNNMLSDARGPGSSARVDFHAHAEALGALTFTVESMGELQVALAAARDADRTTVIVTKVRANDWTLGGAFWEVGVPAVSDRADVVAARAAMDEGLVNQRRGV